MPAKLNSEQNDLIAYIHTIFEDLVLGERRDSLLEMAVANGEERPLVIQEGHARGQC